jgi:(1->4)-alpha-D-glucan 1-alpha-D-glucosylmutase
MRPAPGIAAAGARRPELDVELLGFLRSILVGEVREPEARGLRMRFQQFTGPVAAKGEEDTAFYRYNRFIALNEVGSDPGRWGIGAGEFHDRCQRRAEATPLTLTALSTHDTKRSEDVRARLLVLAEAPERWGVAVRDWRNRNARYWPTGVDRDPGAEHLLYQTLVGAWPIDADRAVPYMVKATREARLRTSWTEPDGDYEAALEAFVRALLTGPFREELDRFVAPLVAPGRVVSLAQKLVHLMAPGVPDIYQGTELWDLSLVDPDNRRPVDFAGRRRLLGELPGPTADSVPTTSILQEMDSGMPKLWLVTRALQVRRSRTRSFGEGGAYEPLVADGPAAEHVLAFRRGDDVMVIVPRFPVRLIREGGWQGTILTVPPGTWTDVMTGARRSGGPASMSTLLRQFPVALLVRDRS